MVSAASVLRANPSALPTGLLGACGALIAIGLVAFAGGLASDPDQVVVGAQFLAGEWISRVAFTPNVELGFGDDFTILSGTAPALYRFRTNSNVTPYVGGGVTLGFEQVAGAFLVR